MKKAIYWAKKPVFNLFDDKGYRTPGHFEMEALEAKVLEDSEPICGHCREPESRHRRRKRRHKFTDPIGGQTLEITRGESNRPGPKTYVLKNVLQGNEYGHWTEKE